MSGIAQAIRDLAEGYAVRRSAWREGQYIILTPGYRLEDEGGREYNIATNDLFTPDWQPLFHIRGEL